TARACQDLIRKGTVYVPDAVYQPGFDEEGVDAAIGSIVGASAGIVVRGACDDADPVGFRRRTLEDLQVRVDDRLVQCMAGVQVPAVSSVQGLLLQVRQEERPEAMEGAVWKTKLLIRPLNPTGRKEAAGILEIVQGQADLLEVIGALRTVGGLAHLL